jgi:hypothetical protein
MIALMIVWHAGIAPFPNRAACLDAMAALLERYYEPRTAWQVRCIAYGVRP